MATNPSAWSASSSQRGAHPNALAIGKVAAAMAPMVAALLSGDGEVRAADG